jgi:hypothetical protein
MRVAVYLVQNILQDRAGREFIFPERRLIRQGPEDEVIAIIEAPRGSRIRPKNRKHSTDHLLIPAGRNFLTRLFRRRAISAKHLISIAREGGGGLVLLKDESEKAKY